MKDDIQAGSFVISFGSFSQRVRNHFLQFAACRYPPCVVSNSSFPNESFHSPSQGMKIKRSRKLEISHPFQEKKEKEKIEVKCAEGVKNRNWIEAISEGCQVQMNKSNQVTFPIIFSLSLPPFLTNSSEVRQTLQSKGSRFPPHSSFSTISA